MSEASNTNRVFPNFRRPGVLVSPICNRCSDNPLHSLSAPNTSNAGASEADLSETRAGHDDYP
ncbi:hypothetical protein F442_13006 [Phytophthora nicotianae P10297]|uniref:Uncharacterized protein n=3 Tax=Phytophthora nicotianae TaxID=4792 RepID=V9ET23_PHYNI|nr:hypothetical protein F443_13121 [Phytophthora nicotianae P1569]ETO58460.1 hypothetical protein F444_23166 [Phytophthora nicotianae P1976]ETP39533.1 hypothetical protein F442_13006 [Phytophthora nicotianae P10297]